MFAAYFLEIEQIHNASSSCLLQKSWHPDHHRSTYSFIRRLMMVLPLGLSYITCVDDYNYFYQAFMM